MSNTLTNLIPTIHQAADVVSRELTGLIPAVTRNSDATRAAVGETIRYPVVGAYTPSAISAAATGPDPSATTVGTDTMTIASSESVTFFWEGEEQRGLNNAGYYNNILRDQFTQAMRALSGLAPIKSFSCSISWFAILPVLPSEKRHFVAEFPTSRSRINSDITQTHFA